MQNNLSCGIIIMIECANFLMQLTVSCSQQESNIWLFCISQDRLGYIAVTNSS